MDGADVCRTSSRASRRPPDVISAVAILDPRWRRRKWRHPGPGAGFSSPIVAVAQNGGPSASGRHLGWPHLREPEMRSSKMATGSGRAAILRHHHNRARKNPPYTTVMSPRRLNIYCSMPDCITYYVFNDIYSPQYVPIIELIWIYLPKYLRDVIQWFA